MTNYRQPRSTEAAAEMLERYAALDGERTEIEAVRNAAIAAINAEADEALAPVHGEMTGIAAKLAPWWAKAGEALTAKVSGGKRKSIELGGCMIGSRTGRDSLAIVGKESDVVELMSALRWAKPFLRFKVSINRPAALRALGGPHGPKLAELGIERKHGEETFFVERAEQRGTLTAN